MKRSKPLLKLSREHHTALVLAKRAQRLAGLESEDAITFVLQLAGIFAQELEPHFQIEEKLLLPALNDAGAVEIAQRTHAEHDELRELLQRIGHDAPATTDLGGFGVLLEKHVRFEERELFPLTESLLPTAILATLETGVANPNPKPKPNIKES